MLADLARRSALHALDRAEALLTWGAEAGLLDRRLAPDGLPFSDQIGLVASFARRAVLPLHDATPGPLDIPSDAPALAVLLAAARREVGASDGPCPERIRHRAGVADLDQAPEDYLATFALPNLWFHLAAAHAILRANDVPVGKADFDGRHAYA